MIFSLIDSSNKCLIRTELESDVTRPLYVLLAFVSGPGWLHVHVAERRSPRPPCFQNCWLPADTASKQKGENRHCLMLTITQPAK